MIIAPGSTSRSITVYAYDATTGLPYSTAAYNDAGIALWYRRGVTGAKTAITPANLSALTDAYSSGGFKAIAENAYRLDVPDAAWASGADMVVIGGSATAWKLIPIEVALETPQTGDSYARIGAAGSGLTAVDDAVLVAIAALNNLSSTDAQAAAAAALAAYDPPTHAELIAELATADDATLAAIAARPSVADFWNGITATAARFIADHTLRRSWASAAVSANGDTLSFRSLLGAVAKLVNRVGISGSTLTVYQDDDTTALGTQAVTSDADAEPITGVNTN